ncbi:MAG TPA: squalene synthase HpnD [Verrucomicrobiales bacterium]|nr:squalene synthase HpnD [Verrucomicrobiales bacterium]HCN76423.1 squalene synthase HpnD [Verrucomicrobiales bacterium]HRJ09408.1 phytoene/squalene synthase family protein [Prosthecobacter sp.]HRK15625.1 phytoene/squalene synthase family protein [Prosthecobacter sp.]
MSDTALTPAQIARKAKSNLALALACLPAQRRHDMIAFYAFCRVVDDIADSPHLSEAEKEGRLHEWKRCVSEGRAPGHPVLDEVVVLPRKYGFPRAWLAEIIDGVASDIGRVRYETYEELLAYCYKVASVVGLVSAEIFGCQNPASRDYAIKLGYALQLTNIMRDVGQDARETGRIYLPLEDLRKFSVTESEILDGRHNQRFVRLMDFEHERAAKLFKDAEKMLPADDRRHLLPAAMMARIYSEILEKLRRERYQVFTRRCRLHPLRKGWILCSYLARAWMGRRGR